MRMFVLLALTACSGYAITESIPLAKGNSAEFASTVRLVKLRNHAYTSACVNSPLNREAIASGRMDPDAAREYHPKAIELATQILRDKGYDVQVVWDDPWAIHGTSNTPCPMRDLREPASLMAADEAYLILTTSSHDQAITYDVTTTTEEHVGRVADRDGNTVADVYADRKQHSTRTEHKLRARALVWLYRRSFATPVLSRDVETDRETTLDGVVRASLESIPRRKK